MWDQEPGKTHFSAKICHCIYDRRTRAKGQYALNLRSNVTVAAVYDPRNAG